MPRADWAWSMSDAAPKIASNKNNSMGLSFQEIQKYDLYQLRAKMDEYGIFDSMKKAKEAYKACEELMAKLVKVLLDPKAKRVVVDSQEDKAKISSISVDSSSELKSTLSGKADAVSGDSAHSGASEATAASATSATPKVRRGDEINLENVPSLSLYELRQELERRGAFGDFLSKKKKITFNNMLNVMQSILLEEKEARDAKRAEALWEKPEDIKARLAKAKADRKAEALERSRIRQMKRKKEEEERKKVEEEQKKEDDKAALVKETPEVGEEVTQ